MNAAALAAQKVDLPLLVIERGIAGFSYIVDLTVPFTAPGSRFRASWEGFRSIVDWSATGTRQLSESRWQLTRDCWVGQAQLPPGSMENDILSLDGACSTSTV